MSIEQTDTERLANVPKRYRHKDTSGAVEHGETAATLPMTADEVMARLETPAGKCPLCGLALGARKDARLCTHCRHFEGLPRDQWGWCSGRHKRATTRRDKDGQWRCLPCQLKRWRVIG